MPWWPVLPSPTPSSRRRARRDQLHAGRHQGALRHGHGAHEGGASRRSRSARPTCWPSATTSPTAPRTGVDDVARQAGAGGRAREAAGGHDLGPAGRHERRRRSASATCSPRASCRCRTPTIPKAACSSPSSQIDEIKKQEARDLTRFDLDFDLPDHFLPEFPPPIFLTTRPDLGDVSQGKLVTIDNFYELFNGILNPKQLEGLRLLVTPFPQQQFNPTDDRRTAKPSRGVACFDCHANGHTNAATHLVGDIRPQEFRHRIDTPSLRGVNIQRLFGSQRALKTVEDFTEFEQRAAYFDGDPVIATKKGVNILERGSQVHFMAEFQELLDFPPAPKLDVFGKLDPAQGDRRRAARPGAVLRQGPVRDLPPAAVLHRQPDAQPAGRALLQAADDQRPRWPAADGPIKTFPLRGIKDSPPYLHDDRLLTLEDTVEFFNLVLGTKLTAAGEAGPGAFLRAL